MPHAPPRARTEPASPTARLHRACAALVFAGSVSLATPALAYRTAAELPEIPDEAVVRWSVPIRLSLNREHASGHHADEVRAVFEQATAAWSRPACSMLEWESIEITDDLAVPADGKSVIQWITADWSERGLDPSAPAITDIQYEQVGDIWQIVEADILLNADLQQFSISDSQADGQTDLLAVATHELGHVLGLRHSCELDEDDASSCVPGPAYATMYPLYDAAQSTLATDDIDGLCFLYATTNGNEPCVGSACPAPNSPSQATDASTCEATSDDGGLDEAECSLPPWSGSDSYDFGELCGDADDCQSHRCLAIEDQAPVCTRSCAGVDDQCPFGWECRTLLDERACAPRETGCSVSALGTQSRRRPSLRPLVIALLFVLGRIRLRSARSGSTNLNTGSSRTQDSHLSP